MNYPRLSLCMIVKDEADHLPSCLESVRHLVDEMIVVDTGSIDETVDVARSLGAEVFLYQWSNDFSKARNESLRHAAGEWILVLDADEVIDQKDHGRIRELLMDKGVDAYRLVQRTYQMRSTLAEWTALEEKTPFARGAPGYIASPLVRLFRNLNRVRFKGRVHELVEHDLLASGRTILDIDIPIHHYGKMLGEIRLQRKRELYRRIGQEKLLDQPFDVRALCELGIQYLEMDLDAAAEEVLTRACGLDPKDPKPAFNLAVALGRQGKKKDSMKIYRIVLDLDPTHIGAYNNLAQILQLEGEYNEAKDLYQKAIEYNPHHHVLYYNYGLLLEKEGAWEAAEEQYIRALDIDPDFSEAQNGLRRVARMTRGYEKEKGDMEGSTPADHQAETRAAEGDHCLADGRYLDALKNFVIALERDSGDAELRYKCGYTLETLGQKDAALEQYQEVLALCPRHAGALFQLALEAERQGLVDDSVTLYQKLLTVSPGHLEAHLNLARVLEGKGDLESAMGHLENVLEVDPGHEGALKRRDIIRERLYRAMPMAKNVEGGLRIAFLWGGPPFLGDTLRKKPLGGTETAMIHMARCLASVANDVTVFVQGGRGEFERVRYRELETYIEELRNNPADIVISARTFHPFVASVPAGARIFWTEDAHDQPFVEPLSQPDIVSRIDRIFTVSRWQTRMLSRQFNIPEEKFYITRNGVSWDHFQDMPEKRNRKKLVYTSTPFRGLEVLLELFPKIRKRVPDAELDIYSSMAVYQIGREADEAQYGHLYRKADQPGVSLKGSVTQPELAKALLSAGILAYPNHFHETSCIAALEAMAAGVPVVTSSLGALPETVAKGGVLIDNDSRSISYQERFVEEICSLMEDRARWERLSEEGRNWVYQHNRWELIAKEWVKEFEQIPRTKSLTGSIFANHAAAMSAEQMMPVERISKNQGKLDGYFGTFFEYMRRSLAAGGSEMGLGVTLFSIAVSINAAEIIEIGRFKGFSTLALAGAMRFLDIGWEEPIQHKQRPDMDYSFFEAQKERKVYSIDPLPTRDAVALIEDADLSKYVHFINQRSDEVKFEGQADLIFIDGDHSYEGCRRDAVRLATYNLRPGGYFILHDYFGWFDEQGCNGSPIKKVVDEIVSQGHFQHVLIDTGYQSFVVFRKPDPDLGI